MASNPQHEPTMEEILASIRKIISEDSNEAQPAAEAPRAAAPAPVVAPAAAAVSAESDVLELTQEVDEAPPPRPEPVRPAPEHAPAAVPPKLDNDIVFETIEEPVQAPESSSSHGDIFSDRTRKAVEDTFANLAPEEPEPVRHEMGPMPGVDARTVEAVFERAVRDSFAPVLTEYLHGNADEIIARMKPLIREWMDEHFPALLEGAVRNEVARVVKARSRR